MTNIEKSLRNESNNCIIDIYYSCCRYNRKTQNKWNPRPKIRSILDLGLHLQSQDVPLDHQEIITSKSQGKWPDLSLKLHLYLHTWNFLLSWILSPLWNQDTTGLGSANIEQWKINVEPSASCRMVGLVTKVGAFPSTWLKNDEKRQFWKFVFKIFLCSKFTSYIP